MGMIFDKPEINILYLRKKLIKKKFILKKKAFNDESFVYTEERKVPLTKIFFEQ
jgi:hypothetical protein